MTEPLRIATVGTGFFSRFHHDAWARMPDVTLAAAASLDAESLQAFADEFSIPVTFDDAEAMLDAVQPDLLDIAAPPPAHLSLIRAAAERGIPAICQKPFCASLAEAEEAAALAEGRDTLLVVHENFRFQPWFAELRRQVDAGVLGEVYQATFRLRPGDGQGPKAYLDRQPYFQTMERFLVHETAIHLIDVFRFLFGEPARVFAALRQLNPVIAGEDAGHIMLDFGAGPRALFDGNRLADHASDNRRRTLGEMLLEGSDATIRLDGYGRLWLRRHGENDEREIAFDWEDRAYAGDCVFRMQRHVIDHLRGRTPVQNTATDYLANLRIEEAVYASHAQGCWIDLPG